MDQREGVGFGGVGFGGEEDILEAGDIGFLEVAAVGVDGSTGP